MSKEFELNSITNEDISSIIQLCARQIGILQTQVNELQTIIVELENRVVSNEKLLENVCTQYNNHICGQESFLVDIDADY
jgi:hypothetical protein